MKTDTIELFNQKMLISERTAQDVLELVEFVQKNQESEKPDMGVHLFAAAQSLSSALKINYVNIPKWRFLKRLKIKNLVSPVNLITKLAPSELFKFQEKIFELEGTDSKKKATAGSRSADQQQHP